MKWKNSHVFLIKKVGGAVFRGVRFLGRIWYLSVDSANLDQQTLIIDSVQFFDFFFSLSFSAFLGLWEEGLFGGLHGPLLWSPHEVGSPSVPF